HRMRFAVINAQWPMLWPTPYKMTTTLYLGPEGTRLLVPVVPHEDRPRPDFLPIEADEEKLPGFDTLDTGTPSGYGEISAVDRNPRTETARIVATNNSAHRYPWGEEYDTESITHEADDNHPETVSVRGEYGTTVKLKDRTLRWHSRVVWRRSRDHLTHTCSRSLRADGPPRPVS